MYKYYVKQVVEEFKTEPRIRKKHYDDLLWAALWLTCDQCNPVFPSKPKLNWFSCNPIFSRWDMWWRFETTIACVHIAPNSHFCDTNVSSSH